MKLVNNILHLEFQELVDCGVSSNTIRCAKRDGSECWSFIDDPEDRRKVLVRFDNLKDKYKQAVQNKYGNPYKYVASAIIKQHLISNETDVQFFNSFRLPDGTALPQNKIDQYTYACKFLFLLSKTKPKDAKLLGFDTMRSFNDGVTAIISAEQVQLPSAYCKLKEKVREYAERGAECIVTRKFGNKNSTKVDENAVRVLRQLYGRPNNFSFEKVTADYNTIAKELGWKTITSASAKLILSKGQTQKQLVAQRNGLGIHRDKFDLVVRRERPSAPLLFLSIDGKSPYELYYQARKVNAKGHELAKYWMRKTVIVVLDAFNNYPLGYHICDEETNENIKLAVKAAIDHTFEITGEYFLPWQIQSDRFGFKELQPFYARIANYVTPAQARNARSKPIESYFRQHDVKYVQPNFNWSGIGITGNKENQANRDYLDKIKQTFPDEAGVIAQIHANFAKDRADKQQAWLESFRATNAQDKRLVSRDRYLEVFGQTTGYTNRLTNKGIVTTINGETRHYMLLDQTFYNTIGTEYTILYDEKDLTTVLAVSNDGRLKFMLPEAGVQPMALKDRKDGDAEKLNKLLDFKKETHNNIIEDNSEDMEYISTLAESHAMLKTFFTLKGANKQLVNRSKLMINPGNGTKKGPDEFDQENTNDVKPKSNDDDVFDI